MEHKVGYERNEVFYELMPRTSFVRSTPECSEENIADNFSSCKFSAQKGYEINILERVKDTVRFLDGGTVISTGLRYWDAFDPGESRTLTLTGPVEESKRVELRTVSDGEVELTVVLPNGEDGWMLVGGTTDQWSNVITLPAGMHLLEWEYIGGAWWLKVD